MDSVHLRVASVGFAYGTTSVLADVSFDLPEGGFGALLGPNGSGKSTLLRLLVGRYAASAGSIAYGGRELAEWPLKERARRIGYLPQEVHAAYPFTVAEVVLMGRYPHLALALESKADEALATRCLERTSTLHLADRLFTTLSGGEKQRVLLASVLAQEARLLLLDEPTAALDIHHQHQVMSLLSELHADGLSIVLVTHDLNLAARYCPRLWLLHEGRITADGGPADVLTPDRLEAVYGERLRVVADPDLGGPVVLPPLPGERP